MRPKCRATPSLLDNHEGEARRVAGTIARRKDRIEVAAGHQFQVCRSIYYEGGESSCGFHTDLEAYGPTNCIASLSLGAGCQENYEHALPKAGPCCEGRLNLTFPKYVHSPARC